MSYFEIGMLVCFGVSWPISISKTLRTKNVEGKSIAFLYIVITGYILGIVHKIFRNPDWVTFLYALNAAMISFDAYLWHKYNVSSKVKESIQLKILRELAKHFDDYTDFNGIRTRRAGDTVFVDIFVKFHDDKNMKQVQAVICDMKKNLELDIKHSEINIIPSEARVE